MIQNKTVPNWPLWMSKRHFGHWNVKAPLDFEKWRCHWTLKCEGATGLWNVKAPQDLKCEGATGLWNVKASLGFEMGRHHGSQTFQSITLALKHFSASHRHSDIPKCRNGHRVNTLWSESPMAWPFAGIVISLHKLAFADCHRTCSHTRNWHWCLEAINESFTP